MNRTVVLAALGILLLTAAGFFWFPGRTWLQSDTQIYVAILEHLWNPAVLAHDIVATHPHVSYTIYDEVALGLRSLTSLEFREILGGLQFVFRALALWGAFLIARSLGFAVWPSLFTASCFGLGAIVNGPAVLTFEYEPIPRAFAGSLIFLSIGLAAHRDWLWAGCAGALAFLFHPPTALPLWIVAGLFWIVLHRRREPLRILAPAAVSVVVLFLLARIQKGDREQQEFFARIDPALEQLQRFRGAYNWIEQWPAEWFWQYPLLLALVAIAWYRLRDSMPTPMQWLSLGLPVYGMASVAFSWLSLDWGRFALIPQLQPARAVLFITAFAVILGSLCGLRAAASRRRAEAFAWFFLVYAIPVNGVVAKLLWPFDALTLTRLLLVAALALLAVALAWHRPDPRVRLVAVIIAALVLIPTWGAVQSYPRLHTPELAELSAWGKSTDAASAVFVFAGFGRDLAPGIFRATALRSIYVDWKGGGQVNLLRALGFEWWRRWQQLREGKYQPGDEQHFAALGITHFVVPAGGPQPAGDQPLFRNARYAVYAAR